MSSFWEIMTILVGGVITVAVVSVVVSKNATTPALVQNWFSGFGNVLGVAQAPVTGTHVPLDLSYAGGSFGSTFAG